MLLPPFTSRLERIHYSLSSVHHAFKFYPQDSHPGSVVSILQTAFPHFSRRDWDDRLTTGGIFVNGRPVQYDYSPYTPFYLEFFEPKYLNQGLTPSFPRFEKHWIVFEDEWLLVVHKPQGLATLPTREQHVWHLKGELERYVGGKIHLPSRLDTSTEGLVVVSKSESTHNVLNQQFAKRIVKKRYLFEGTGSVPWREKIVSLNIAKEPLHPVLRTTSTFDGKSARTDFTQLFQSSLIDACGKTHVTSFIVATPHTGRTHQIRVHARSVGIPIVGDHFYEGAFLKPNAGSLRLFSFELQLQHPVNKKLITFYSPKNLWPQWACAAFGMINPTHPRLPGTD